MVGSPFLGFEWYNNVGLLLCGRGVGSTKERVGRDNGQKAERGDIF